VVHSEVLVIGAGVIGLTTAVCLAEEGLRVRVRASEPPAATTSAVAGAMTAGPIPLAPAESAARWHRTSLVEFGSLAEQVGTGVRTARGRMALPEGDGVPDWAKSMAGFEPCAPEEHAGYPVAFWITSPLVDMPRYLEYLAGRLAAAGGELEIRQVPALDEVTGEYRLVVNCTGTGASGLAGDQQVRPVRGQQVVVDNPGLDEFFMDNGPGPMITSIMPHGGRLVLGGTIDRGEWNRDPDPLQTEEILRRCSRVEPRLAGVTVRSVEVGLRPGRPQVRLEQERIGDALVIHNYGHGGVGVSVSWGCARQVQHLVAGAVVP
jgi:D-amino-acid oxidase